MRFLSIQAIAGFGLALTACLSAVCISPAAAQIASVDPDRAIDGDIAGSKTPTPIAPTPGAPAPVVQAAPSALPASALPAPAPTPASSAAPAGDSTATYRKEDLMGAAEGVFGKGAEGLAGVIEDLLRKQGQPNGYIIGREGGGAMVVGVRYGSGTLNHKIEGTRPVYWTGPSLGIDAGANAAKAFVLVYNLNDTQDLYHRYGAGEGQAYLVGGFHVSYMRRKDVVLIPVRMGAGLRLGVNVGYMKFSEKLKWLPF